MNDTTEVAVIGGGATGLALSCLLADGGIDVAVVEGSEPRGMGSAATPAYGLRTSSISPASQRLLERVGAWQHIPPGLRTPYRSMHVWERPGARPLQFDAADARMDCLGHIVDNAALVTALERALETRRTARWYRPARLYSVFVDPDAAEVELSTGIVQARLVVGADGASSKVREDAGVTVRERDFGQRALVSIVRCAAGHGDTAWQRFLPTGPIALLPLDGDRCSLIWSTTPEHAEHLERTAPANLEDELNVALHVEERNGPGPFTIDGPRASFPLRAIEARSYHAPRIALVGDAAQTVHPLAGQGVNLGLIGAAMLAETVVARHAAGRDIGRENNLRPYDRACRARNLAMGRALEGLHDVFGQRLPLLSGLRSAAFSLVDQSAAAKRLFVRAASGDIGETPAVMR